MKTDKKHIWQNEWLNMPEYNNTKPCEPEFTTTFKFRNKTDFEKFMNVVKNELYDGKRVFDGRQMKNNYSAWFPLDPRPSEFVYVVESE